jgi:hypothetical protein
MGNRAIVRVVGLAATCALLTGCATAIRQPAAGPQPATERLGTFRVIELEGVTLAADFAAVPANKKDDNA